MKQLFRTVCALTCFWAVTSNAADVQLRSHDAVYAMRQVKTSERGWSGIERADGVLRYKFRNACDGWTVEHQSAMHLDLENAQQVQMSWSYTSWEAHDGKRMRFHSRMKRNGVQVESFSGEARREEDKTVVVYADPNGRREELPVSTRFPTMHLIESLKFAQRGEPLFSVPYFDGSGEETYFDVDSVITPAKGKPLVRVEETVLPNQPAWNMQLAFYVPDQQGSIADTQIGARYRLDGVSTALKQDFGDMVLEGRLVELTYVDEPDCTQKKAD